MTRGRGSSAGRHVAPGRIAPDRPDYHGRHAARSSDQPVPRRRRWGLLVTVVMAVAAAVLVKMFFLQAYLIPSGSMENTLRVGDRVLTNRLVYQLHGIHRGDVVVFSGAGTWDGPAPTHPSLWDDLAVRAGLEPAAGTIYVKRVIGLPGDTVACCDTHGRVTVNGVALEEASYVHDNSYWDGSCTGAGAGRCFGPVTVAPGMLWVMGDHRSVSDDSRRHLTDPGGGTVESSRVVGKAILVLWPPSHLRTVGAPATFAGVPAVAMLLLPYRRRHLRRSRRRSRLRSRRDVL